MKKLFVITTTIIISNLILSCTKHKGDFKENVPVASMTVMSPSTGAIVNLNEVVEINAQAISTATIHGYDISITSPGDTTNYFSKHVHDHNDTLNIHETWTNTLVSKNLLLNITLTLDHDGHTFTRKVEFRAK